MTLLTFQREKNGLEYPLKMTSLMRAARHCFTTSERISSSKVLMSTPHLHGLVVIIAVQVVQATAY
jgi:hypothetical protein